MAGKKQLRITKSCANDSERNVPDTCLCAPAKPVLFASVFLRPPHPLGSRQYAQSSVFYHLFTCIVIILASTLCFTTIPAQAAGDAVFRMDIDSLNLRKGVSANIVISLENAQGARVQNIEGIEGFDILSQSQSTSTSFINGEVTYRIDFHYTVMPKAAGQYTLKANIQYNGQNHETNALQVSISETSGNENESAQNLYIKTIISNEEAYLGEKIVITYELYSRYSIENFGFRDPITIDGVLTKEIPGNQPKAEYVYIDGNRYAKYQTRQLIIDPVKQGVYTIPSFNIQVNVVTGGGNSFFRSSAPMYLQTEEKVLTIKPLPTDGKPGDFSGVVGQLRLDGRYSRMEMKYGDSFALYTTASGNCNLDGMKNIIIGEMPGISVYETQKNVTESVENNQYHVEKAFEAILVPEKTGALEVSPISISYFDPVSGKYEKAEIPGITINVLGDMPQPSNFNDSQTGTVETVTINQVNYSNIDDGYFTIKLSKEWLNVVLICFITLIILAVALVKIVSNRSKQDPVMKSLKKKLLSSDDINETYNLFNAMIKHCYKFSLKASSRSIIQNNLHDTDFAEQVADIMDYMESAKTHDDKGHIYLKNKMKKAVASGEWRVKDRG